jgi:trehalose 6-phosphate phosphatase
LQHLNRGVAVEPTADESLLTRSPARLNKRHWAFFFDVDGTLIDIAPRPDAVVVPASLVNALRTLKHESGGAVALVSGRTIANLDELFQPLRLSASGVHGAEIRFGPDASVVVDPQAAVPPDLVGAIRQIAAAYPATLVENKTYSVAVHYRNNPSAGWPLKEGLERLLAPTADAGWRILPGHMVFEIKRASFDKGRAIRRFMDRPPFAGRRPVFFGDDVTDRPGFEAVLQLGGQAFSVGTDLPGSTGMLSDPSAVRDWVLGLIEP